MPSEVKANAKKNVFSKDADVGDLSAEMRKYRAARFKAQKGKRYILIKLPLSIFVF